MIKKISENIRHEPQSQNIYEKIFININGVRQGMFIKGKNRNNPVLLYLHGGMPDYFLTQKYPTKLEDDFVVVWWEQRGLGISYNSATTLKTVSQDQLIRDTIELTNYLCGRFNKKKIFLMGHSGGTFIGIQVVALVPELYEAYIGVSQMSNQAKSEELAYKYMLGQFKKNKNYKMFRKLGSTPTISNGKLHPNYARLRDSAMHILGIGTTHEMKSVFTGIVLPSIMFKEYTFGEKIRLWLGKFKSGVSVLLDTILATDLNSVVKTVKVPVYFFHGKYDYTVSYSEARAYFKKLKASLKGFYTFDKSAHSPMFEEPEKMERILREDVLWKRNCLADRE